MKLRLDYYRKAAKKLLKELRAGDEQAARRFALYHPRIKDGSQGEAKLADAHLVVAREARFDSWPKLKHCLEAIDGSKQDKLFESVVDAVVWGKLDEVRDALQDAPWLATAPSSRAHRATLLHYSSANGIEDHRQRTPPNAVEIADLLIEAGADINAVTAPPGGGPGSTPLVGLVTGGHPVGAGLMDDLVRSFARSGQNLSGVEDDGLPIAYALLFRNVSAAQTLAECGARIDSVAVAAGLGRLELVERMIDDSTPPGAEPGVLPKVIWRELGRTEAVEHALLFASIAGEAAVVRFLIDRGADVNGRMNHDRTPLHEAAFGGHVEVVRMLVGAGARTDVREKQFNSTPAEWARHAGYGDVAAYLEAANGV